MVTLMLGLMEIEVLNKIVQLIFGVWPNAKNVIDIAFPKQRGVICRRKSLLFPIMHENVGKSGCVLFAHSSAFDL